MKLPAHVSNAVKRLNPEVFEAGAPRLRTAHAEPAEHPPLVRKGKGKAEGGMGSKGRARIRFTVYSVRPCDWDNYYGKLAQDLIVAAGILPDDRWDLVEGAVRSCKAESKDQERTEIEIIWP